LTLRFQYSSSFFFLSNFAKETLPRSYISTAAKHFLYYSTAKMPGTLIPSEISSTMGTTEILSSWIESLTWESVPEEIKTRTKHLLLDSIGCAMLGARLPWSTAARNALVEIEGSGACSIFGWEEVSCFKMLFSYSLTLFVTHN
jgi:hypothetical protein